MTIKIRKESFGYVLFRQQDRKYFIVDTDVNGQSLLFLTRQYFPEVKSADEIFVIPNENYQRGLSLSSPMGMYLEISQDVTSTVNTVISQKILAVKECY